MPLHEFAFLSRSFMSRSWSIDSSTILFIRGSSSRRWRRLSLVSGFLRTSINALGAFSFLRFWPRLLLSIGAMPCWSMISVSSCSQSAGCDALTDENTFSCSTPFAIPSSSAPLSIMGNLVLGSTGLPISSRGIIGPWKGHVTKSRRGHRLPRFRGARQACC